MSIENEEAGLIRNADRKIAESVSEAAKRIQQEEDNKLQAKIEEAATKRYDEVKRLGFVTKKELEEFYREQEKKTDISALQQRIDDLQEIVLRAKARGQLDSGVLDDSPKPSDMKVKSWQKNTLDNLEKRGKEIFK